MPSRQAQEDFKSAATAYLRVQALYPEAAEWVAGSMFEGGKCLEQLGKPDEAKKAYRDVVDKYKGTKWADLAAERLK